MSEAILFLSPDFFFFIFLSPTPPLQLYELDGDPKRKEFLDDLFSFMQKRGELLVHATDDLLGLLPSLEAERMEEGQIPTNP